MFSSIFKNLQQSIVEWSIDLKKLREQLVAELAEEVAHKAEVSAKSADRVYRISLNGVPSGKQEQGAGKDLNIFVFGCHGNGSQAQRDVAEFMEETIKKSGKKPHLIILLGDNNYTWGANAANHPMFDPNFYSVYLKIGTELAKIPCMVILGNHDENLHKLQMLGTERGYNRGITQVAHTYLPFDYHAYQAEPIEGLSNRLFHDITSRNQKICKETVVAALKRDILRHVNTKKEFYAKKEWNLSEMYRWNMPHFYYSTIIDDHTQIFYIDSNTYVRDYLDAKKAAKEANHDFENQATWLKQQMVIAKNAGYRTILKCHHPLETNGNRAYESDAKYYLTDDEIQRTKDTFNIHDKHGTSYNAFLKHCMQAQNLEFDLVVSAHDHNMSYYNNTTGLQPKYPLRQVVAGGGGGGLQKRMKYSNQKEMGTFIKEHGFVELTCPSDKKDPINIKFHSIDPKHHNKPGLQEFYSNNLLPLQKFSDKISEQEQLIIIRMCTVIKKSIDKYFSFIGDKQDQYEGDFFKKTQNLSHGHVGVSHAHNLWKFINQSTIDFTFSELLQKIEEETSRHTEASEHSLITILNEELMETLGSDFSNAFHTGLKNIEHLRAGVLQATDQFIRNNLSNIPLNKIVEKVFEFENRLKQNFYSFHDLFLEIYNFSQDKMIIEQDGPNSFLLLLQNKLHDLGYKLDIKTFYRDYVLRKADPSKLPEETVIQYNALQQRSQK